MGESDHRGGVKKSAWCRRGRILKSIGERGREKDRSNKQWLTRETCNKEYCINTILVLFDQEALFDRDVKGRHV